MKTYIFRVAIIFSLFTALSACGNKGDLYLPEKEKDNTTQQP